MNQVDVTTPVMAPGASAPVNRVNALDITKGFLVILMVAYHTINYSSQYFLAFRYMAFLPPTFIIITGFLLTRIYGTRSSDRGVHPRLFLRGGKLLLLFTALNIAAQFVRSGNYHGQSLGFRNFIVHWPDTFLIGGSRAAAFEILLPIAYILLLAPALVWLDRIHNILMPILTISVVLTCAAFELTGTTLPNLYLLSAGLVGMLLGRLSWERLKHLKSSVLGSLLAYVIYVFIASKFGQSFLLQLTGSLISLAAIYGFSLWIGALRPASVWSVWLIRLGNYSLLAYIIQIAILQGLSHVLGRPDPFSIAVYAFGAATLFLTTTFVEIMHRARARLRTLDFMYRNVFP